MAKLLKLRRGTTSQHSSFTGAEGEVTVDTTKDTLVVHDGSTAGGHPIAKESANLSLIDEDNMATNSATRPPSQQSVKAYADTKASPPASAGTVGTSETVQVDSNKDITGFRNVTLTGELDAATGDFSGDVDVDGTLEADAVTVNGTALNEYIADTVGAMVTGNTETGITVTYEDGDNTLDFVVGNSATTTEATNVTVVANNSTDETVYPTFVDGATGTQGIETDTGLTYNPSTGLLTSVGLTLSGNLTVNGTTTTINSTTLAVDDKNIELGTVDTPSDTTADGGGITLKGATDKTITWANSTDTWDFNQGIKTTGGITASGSSEFIEDVKFDGSTAGRDILFDRSEDKFHFADSAKAVFGESSDLKIYHDGNNSFIESTTGNLLIKDTTGTIYLQSTRTDFESEDGEQIAHFISDGAVELYHDDFKSFETYSRGISVYGPEGDHAEVYIYADEGDDNADKWRLQADTSGNFKVGNYSTGSWVNGLTLDGSNNVTFAGSVTDSKGDVRSIPQTDQTGSSSYTIHVNDRGKCISRSGGNISFPTNNGSVLTAGDAVTILNNSASDITIDATSTSWTLYNTADGATGNRTLAARGLATIYVQANAVAYISGAGLS